MYIYIWLMHQCFHFPIFLWGGIVQNDDNMMVKMDELKMDVDMMEGKRRWMMIKWMVRSLRWNGLMYGGWYDGWWWWKMIGKTWMNQELPKGLSYCNYLRMPWNTRYSPSIHPPDVGFQHRAKNPGCFIEPLPGWLGELVFRGEAWLLGLGRFWWWLSKTMVEVHLEFRVSWVEGTMLVDPDNAALWLWLRELNVHRWFSFCELQRMNPGTSRSSRYDT